MNKLACYGNLLSNEALFNYFRTHLRFIVKIAIQIPIHGSETGPVVITTEY